MSAGRQVCMCIRANICIFTINSVQNMGQNWVAPKCWMVLKSHHQSICSQGQALESPSRAPIGFQDIHTQPADDEASEMRRCDTPPCFRDTSGKQMLLCVYTGTFKIGGQIVVGCGWAPFFSARAEEKERHRLPYSHL